MFRRIGQPLAAAAAVATGAAAVTYYSHGLMQAAASPISSPPPPGLELLRNSAKATHYVVCSPTFYPNLQDVRLQLGLDACRQAKNHGVPLLLIDASPPDVKAALLEAGATAVIPQTFKGRKGAALRECIHVARSVLDDDGVIAFQELEKVDMIAQQRSVAQELWRSGLDVIVQRADDAFKATYLSNSITKRSSQTYTSTRWAWRQGFPMVSIGPWARLLRATMAKHWLNDDGELWDAQIVPYVRAARWHGAKVGSIELEYHHPLSMSGRRGRCRVGREAPMAQLPLQVHRWSHQGSN